MELPSLSVCNSIHEQKFLEQSKPVESNVCGGENLGKSEHTAVGKFSNIKSF